MTSVAPCCLCNPGSVQRQADGVTVFCAACSASFDPTRGALKADYATLYETDLAAYIRSDIEGIRYFQEPTDGLFEDVDKPLPIGYIYGVFGVLRHSIRSNSPFKHLFRVEGDPYAEDAVASFALEVWEARVWLPGKPRAYWQKLWRPDGEQEAKLLGAEREALNAKQRSRLHSGGKIIAVLPLPHGGRPHRAPTLTAVERAELATYDDKKKQLPDMSDADLAKYHLGYSYGHLRYLLGLRKKLRGNNIC